jgi:hypothetical protein
VLFGGIGLGLYLRSWRDGACGCALALVVHLATAALSPGTSLGVTAGVLGAYAYVRVMRSNRECARSPAQA